MRFNTFDLSRYLTQSLIQMFMRFNGWDPKSLGHHIDGFRHCGSGDKTFLICHMISRFHMFKGLCDFVGGSSHSKSPLFLAQRPELLLQQRYNVHYVKSVQIASFFWSVFSCIWTEYGDLLHKSLYSVQIQENTAQKKLRIWTLFTQ